jgi:hypothetical protein
MQELSEIPARPARDFPNMAAVSFKDVIDDQDEASSFPADDLPSSIDVGVKELSEQEPLLGRSLFSAVVYRVIMFVSFVS